MVVQLCLKTVFLYTSYFLWCNLLSSHATQKTLISNFFDKNVQHNQEVSKSYTIKPSGPLLWVSIADLHKGLAFYHILLYFDFVYIFYKKKSEIIAEKVLLKI